MENAFGQMLLDGTGPEIIERDDGFIDAGPRRAAARVRTG
jgi:hypothetical protein